MNTLSEPRSCPQCGAPIPAGAAEGLCPRCLLALNLATQTHLAGETQPPAAGGAPAVPPLPLEEVAKLFPQLEIIRLVGTGGMGAVYQARQPALDRHVALKLLHTPPANDPGFAERFSQEARALAKLNHPNIVALHEFGQAGGRPYFLMEFVDGVNLRQLQQAERLSPREALQIVPQVCDALQYAHDEGIVHRDIKPENVLIDRKGRVKVADFGLAKLMGKETATARLTGAGHVMGTPHYMAPEQVEHPLDVDHRADIFSLGVVFYELLTGELPLGKFPMPSKKVRIDVRLDEVVLRALEKEPALRYGQASELKTRVETIAGASGMGASSVMEPGKFKRSRGQIVSGSLGWVLMAVGIAINITPFQPYGLAVLVWGGFLSLAAAVVALIAENSPARLKVARGIMLINGIGLLSVTIPLSLDCPWMQRSHSDILVIAASGGGIVFCLLKLLNAGPFKTRRSGGEDGENPPSSGWRRVMFILGALLIAGGVMFGVRAFIIAP
ncbi:MAG TPA: serine/threonine-protein kinase, partial [Rariglobus sp.]